MCDVNLYYHLHWNTKMFIVLYSSVRHNIIICYLLTYFGQITLYDIILTLNFTVYADTPNAYINYTNVLDVYQGKFSQTSFSFKTRT